jgi:hypothetical protein
MKPDIDPKAVGIVIPEKSRRAFPGSAGRASIYGRVSGANDVRTMSLATQAQGEIDPLIRDKFYLDYTDIRLERWSGIESAEFREQFEEILRLAKQGYYKAVAFNNADRWVRGVDVVHYIKELERAGCVVYIQGERSVPSPDRDLKLAFDGYVSINEARLIASRTGRIKKAINDSGDWLGGGSVTYGLVFDKRTRERTKHETYAGVVEREFEMIARGDSLSFVARQFNAEGIDAPGNVRRNANNPDRRRYLWSEAVVYSHITNPTYMGMAYRNRMRYKLDDQGNRIRHGKKWKLERVPREEWILCQAAKTEAIVSSELWEAANAALRSRNTLVKKDGRRQESRFVMLRGVLYCSHCHHRMYPYTQMVGRPGKKRRHAFYRCDTRSNPRLAECPCPGNSVAAAKIERFVMPWIEGLIRQPEVCDDLIDAAYREDGTEAEIIARRDHAADSLRDARRAHAALMADLDDPDLDPTSRAAIRQHMRIRGEEGRTLEALIRDCEDQLVPLRNRQQIRDEHKRRVREIRESMAEGPLTPEKYRKAILGLGVSFRYAKDKAEMFIDNDLPGDLAYRVVSSVSTAGN